MSSFFPPELRTLGVIRRWSVVWTLTEDTVSNHSFFVSLYANQIAKMIRWQGDYGQLLFTAIAHDAEENASGDIVAPAKQAMLDTQRAQSYLREQMLRRMPTIINQQDAIAASPDFLAIKRIVKAADRLDALLFLTVEKRMGNGVVAPRIPEVYEGLRASWQELPADSKKLAALWIEVKDAVTEHATSGGFGV